MGKWFTEPDLRDFDPLWLLELTFGGVVYRFATETVTISNDDESLLFHGTLSNVDYVSELEFASEDFELPSASATITFREDIAKRIAQGADLGAAKAELSLFRKGSDDDYDDRQVLVSGAVDLPSYGALGEPVSLNIEADWLRDSVLIPPPEHVIDTAVNWDDADENTSGAVYPILIGAPGSQGFGASPIYVVDDGSGSGVVKGLLAGHPVTAATIKVVRVSGDTGAATILSGEAVTADQDDNGIIFSYVTLTGQYAAGDSYFARMEEGGGGLLNPYRRGRTSSSSSTVDYLSGAGDVLRYLLHQSGAKVDDGRTAAAAELLNAYEIDCYIGERTDVMEFIKSELLPLLPCSLRASSEGLFPVVWRYDATIPDAKAKLTADRHIYRASDVEYEGTAVFNEITMRYRLNARYNKLRKQVTVTGDQTRKTSGMVWKNDYAVTSQTKYGLKALDVESDLVSSRATAGRIINWMSRAFSGRHRKIEYRAPYKLGWLEVGDIIALTDSELHFDNQVALLQAIEWTEDDLLLSLLVIPDLPRDTIPVG